LKNNEDGFILTESTSVETTLDDDDDDDHTHIIFSEFCLQFLCSLLLV
jgi:hypothetical protein